MRHQVLCLATGSDAELYFLCPVKVEWGAKVRNFLRSFEQSNLDPHSIELLHDQDQGRTTDVLKDVGPGNTIGEILYASLQRNHL